MPAKRQEKSLTELLEQRIQSVIGEFASARSDLTELEFVEAAANALDAILEGHNMRLQELQLEAEDGE